MLQQVDETFLVDPVPDVDAVLRKGDGQAFKVINPNSQILPHDITTVGTSFRSTRLRIHTAGGYEDMYHAADDLIGKGFRPATAALALGFLLKYPEAAFEPHRPIAILGSWFPQLEVNVGLRWARRMCFKTGINGEPWIIFKQEYKSLHKIWSYLVLA